ncbi:hypothetical protein Rmet_6760 (plasmid) [Cupriavidus metallidurans CH34]|uniref:Uncharacterized protein n=1 Tax=Cupriavidus metallidurans (strain ATCC 43123 / DSM 2839 / NBRC 102507 / CH34) TaxID=266264 RepID=D3DYG9_CUPMC|nr:hypothetical protein Rmet_6760 [Cupriavidus metallidurans CH34]
MDSFLIDHFAGKSTGSVIRAKHADLTVRLASAHGSHTWRSQAQATVHCGPCGHERQSIRGFNAQVRKLPEIGTGRLMFNQGVHAARTCGMDWHGDRLEGNLRTPSLRPRERGKHAGESVTGRERPLPPRAG